MVTSRDIYGILGTIFTIGGIVFFLVFGPIILVYGPDWEARLMGVIILALAFVWMWVIRDLFKMSMSKLEGKGIIRFLFEYSRR
jgi:hypothetical protein